MLEKGASAASDARFHDAVFILEANVGFVNIHEHLADDADDAEGGGGESHRGEVGEVGEVGEEEDASCTAAAAASCTAAPDRLSSGAFSSHWSPYDRVGVVNADP